MTGPIQPRDQPEDPRESTVDMPRVDLAGLTDYFRGAAPPPASVAPAAGADPAAAAPSTGGSDEQETQAGVGSATPGASTSGASTSGASASGAETAQSATAELSPAAPSTAGAGLTGRDGHVIRQLAVSGTTASGTASFESDEQASSQAAPQAAPDDGTRPAAADRPAVTSAAAGHAYAGEPVPDHSGQPRRAAVGSLADLRSRLARLPNGHPSSPWDDSGRARPLPVRLRHLELGLPAPGREAAADARSADQTSPAAAPGRTASRAAERPADRTVAAAGDQGAEHSRPEAPTADESASPPADRIPAADSGHHDDRSEHARNRDSHWQDPYAAEPAANGGSQRHGQPPSFPAPALGPWPAPSERQPFTRPGTGGNGQGRPANGSRADSSGPHRSDPHRYDNRSDPNRSEPNRYDANGSEPHRGGPNPGFGALPRPSQPGNRPAGGRGFEPTAEFRPAQEPRAPGADWRSRGTGEPHDSYPAERDRLRPGRGQQPEGKPVPRRDGFREQHQGTSPPAADLLSLTEHVLAACRAAEGRSASGRYGASGLTPAIQRVAAQLPAGGLAPGSEADTLKPADRFTAKLSRLIARNPERSPADLAASISDVIRYAFAFEPADYTEGTWLVHRKLKAQGFELEARRNRWESPERKGIFTRWRDPAHGIAFEIQFHTLASWTVAKSTHDAHVAITDPATPAGERARLRARQVTASTAARMPPGCQEIGDFRLEPR